ncbi:MAG: hypothetical protein GX995_02580 [Clostridiales bacterium]|nr:hypothetical protein [Clostridiales bacterium]
MKIKIISKEKNINLNLPTRLLFNGLTARIAAKAINDNVDTNNLELTSKDMKRLFDELNRIKRKYPDLVLVDVESASGEIVKIKL